MRSKVFGIGGDHKQRLGGPAEQEVVDDGLVLVGDRGDLGRQREDDMEIADRQQIGLARREPILRRRPLTLGAVAIAARVVGDAAVPAIFAALDMPAERGRTALAGSRAPPEAGGRSYLSSPWGRLAPGQRRTCEPGEPVERADDGADRRTGNAGVKCRGVEFGVAEERLDHADVEQVGGKAVPHVCGETRLLIPAARGADNAAKLAGRQRLDRVAPGKQPASRQQQAAPSPSRHQARNSSSSCGDRIAWRSLPPLPRSTRSSMRSESMSPTFNATTSETRSPAPQAVANAALYFGADAACSSSVTSSTLNATVMRRGCGTTVSRRAKSARSTVTVKKQRRAETALLVLGGCMPFCVWCSW